MFKPYAQCLTNLPTSFWSLIKQRRRWEWAIVTFECRKHIDMANIFSPNFRLSNLALLVDRWLYSIVLQLIFWPYLVWMLLNTHEHFGKLMVFYYLCYLMLKLVQTALIFYYSTDRRRDMTVMLIAPLMPFYHLIQRGVSCWAIFEEMLTRRSFRDGFVPKHVREVTWHW